MGYCVADTEKDECDDVLLCPYCKKWWCEPTNESFIKIRKYIRRIIIYYSFDEVNRSAGTVLTKVNP